ncbi:MAG: hypothetical protein JW927_08785 [Deltaproteobacteria bacterium]|nr:hypothetical protein [Deltaproteobacteria bacterium]
MNMKLKRFCFYIALTMIVICSGCKHVPKNITPEFGKSYKTAFTRQVLNPDAPKDQSPVVTLPGNVGSEIYHKRYIKSLTEEKKSDDSISEELSDMD